MRIPVLVQHTRTRKYLKKDGKWTLNESHASTFLSAKAAIEYCLGAELKDVELVYRFEGFDHKVTVPLALEGIGKKS
jgi:hypothetical protein